MNNYRKRIELKIERVVEMGKASNSSIKIVQQKTRDKIGGI